MNVGIEKILTYLPEETLTVKQFYNQMDEKYKYKKSEQEINFFMETSHYEKVVVEEKRDRIEFIDSFFEKLMEYYKGQDFDYVIYSTDIPESTRDKIVYQLYFLNKYNFKNVNYITMNQQCGTQLNALAIATSMIKCNQARRILIISHSYKDELKKRLLEGYGIIGDGVVGIVVSEEAKNLKYIDLYTKTSSEFYDLNRTPKGGMSYYQYLYNGVDGINQLLKRNNIEIQDIKYIIPQNVSALEWDFYCPRLKCNYDQVYLKNISRYGHLGDADAFINLHDVITQNQLSNGDYILLQSVGAGATFNSMLLQY